jgi:hypothetical protein
MVISICLFEQTLGRGNCMLKKPFHVIGSGQLTEAQREKLTEREKKALDAIADQRGLP